MNLENPLRSVRRILTLIVILPATALAVAAGMATTDFKHYAPEPGSVRLVIEPGWPR